MTVAPSSGASRRDAIGLWARPRVGMFWGGVWLVYLVPAFREALSVEHGVITRATGVGLLAAFVVVYLWAMFAAWDHDDEQAGRPRNLWVGGVEPRLARIGLALTALAVLSTAVVGEEGVATFVFLSPVAASVLPGRHAPLGIALAVLATVVGQLVAVPYGEEDVTASGMLATAFGALMAGAIVLGIRRMRVVMWELHVARQDAERLASAEERVRISRDLHDVLGHSLTVISMRSQLAAKLVERGEVSRAGEEIRAVEQLSRTAMSDVRQAVAGYRIRPFAAELAAAEATLSGAGVTVAVERSTGELPAGGEEALGFVVREGVTNVLRHSSARACSISVRHTDGTVVVELADDGRGAGTPLRPLDGLAGEGPAGEGDGCGLHGLAERVAAAGGRLSAGDGPAGGFVLRAEVGR